MPGLDFAAEILVEHWREDEMVVVGNERHVGGSGQFQGGEESCKPAADDHDPWLCHGGGHRSST